MNKRYLLLGIGISICLLAAGIMFEGTVFGDRTSGIATVLGIVGIGVIATSNTIDRKKKR